SRRRHTRSKRDWSSDVCSSDLFGPLPMVALSELVTRRNSPVGLGLPAASTWRIFMPFRLDFDSSISAPRNSTPAGSAMSSFRRLALSICALNGSEGSSTRSEEHTSELQSRFDLVCRLLLEKKKNNQYDQHQQINNHIH